MGEVKHAILYSSPPPLPLRLAERFRQAGTAQQAAEAQVVAVQQQLERTQREVAQLKEQVREEKGGRGEGQQLELLAQRRWLTVCSCSWKMCCTPPPASPKAAADNVPPSTPAASSHTAVPPPPLLQVSELRNDAGAKEQGALSLASQREALAEATLTAARTERDEAAQRAEAAGREVSELGRRHAAEMAHVEARVKAALARKDEAVSGLRGEVAALSQQLCATEAVLAQQQKELGEY